MNNEGTQSELLQLLIEAISREVQVSVQYMMQHGVGAGHAAAGHGAAQGDKPAKFVASHSQVWLPGVTLKKIAITEMQHAEAIVERVVLLGGEPREQVNPITLGKTAKEMIADDVAKEQEAIELYTRIIEAAVKAGDDVTASLFRKILSDEEKHHQVFSGLLGAG